MHLKVLGEMRDKVYLSVVRVSRLFSYNILILDVWKYILFWAFRSKSVENVLFHSFILYRITYCFYVRRNFRYLKFKVFMKYGD